MLCHNLNKPPSMNSIHIHLYQGKQELKLHTQWLHGRDFVQFGKIAISTNERTDASNMYSVFSLALTAIVT